MFLLFVHPGYAGHGIGRALLTAAHGALRASGCPEAFLFVHEGNERALAVYAALPITEKLVPSVERSTWTACRTSVAHAFGSCDSSNSCNEAALAHSPD